MIFRKINDQQPQPQTIEQKLFGSIFEMPAKVSLLGKDTPALTIMIGPQKKLSFIKNYIDNIELLTEFTLEILQANYTPNGLVDYMRCDFEQAQIAEIKNIVMISYEELEQLPEVVQRYDINMLTIVTALDQEVSAEHAAKILDLIKAQTKIEALQIQARLSTEVWAQIADLTNTSNINALILRGCYLSDAEAKVFTAISKKLFLGISKNNIEWPALSDLYANNNLYLIANSNPGSSHNDFKAAVCKRWAFVLANEKVKTILERTMQTKHDAENPEVPFDPLNTTDYYVKLNEVMSHAFERGQVFHQAIFPTQSSTDTESLAVTQSSKVTESSTADMFSKLSLSIKSLVSSFTGTPSVTTPTSSASIVAEKKSSTSTGDVFIKQTLHFKNEPKPHPLPAVDMDQTAKPVRYNSAK